MNSKYIVFIACLINLVIFFASCDRIADNIENDEIVFENSALNMIDTNFYSSFQVVKLPIEFNLNEMYFVWDSTYALNEISSSNLKYIYETSNDIYMSTSKYYKYGIYYGASFNYVFYIKKMENVDWLVYMICMDKNFKYFGKFIICGSLDNYFTRICSKITESDISIIQLNEIRERCNEEILDVKNEGVDYIMIKRKMMRYKIGIDNKISFLEVDTSSHKVSLRKFHQNLSQLIDF